jgi:hypothetical protein
MLLREAIERIGILCLLLAAVPYRGLNGIRIEGYRQFLLNAPVCIVKAFQTKEMRMFSKIYKHMFYRGTLVVSVTSGRPAGYGR